MFCEVGVPTESAPDAPVSALGGTRVCAGGCGVAVSVVLVGGSPALASDFGTVDGLAVAHLLMHPAELRPRCAATTGRCESGSGSGEQLTLLNFTSSLSSAPEDW